MILINQVSIKKIINSKKKNKLKIGLCHGVFDVVHPGHINHFLFCKTKCDFLVVSVTSDKFVMKGPHRPIFTLQKRMEFLNSIKFIDLIIPSNYLDATYNIDLIKPQFYFKGQEYNFKKISIDKNLVKEINSLKKNRGKIMVRI
jgi:cytidyltransferase-like protein